jgi:hypothetical protein
MTAKLTLSTAVRNARSEALKNQIDSVTDAGSILFYTLPLPATTGAAITTQVLIAECPLSKPCGSVSAGKLTFAVINPDLTANNTGVIAFGRLVDGDGNFISDGSAGLAGSSEVFKFNKLDALAGGIVRILSAEIIEGNT